MQVDAEGQEEWEKQNEIRMAIKEGIEYIFQEFSVALIVLPSFRNKRECTEEEWEKETEKIKGLLTLENDLRFLLQPEFNPRAAQVSKSDSRPRRMQRTKTETPKQAIRQPPSRPTTETSHSKKQFLVLNLAKLLHYCPHS